MAEFTPTPGQALAISDRGGELLVSAAAGSGKTRVLIERLMGYILGENRSDVDSFLIITFTRAAGEQLRGKIGEHISELAESAAGGQAAYLRRQRALLRRAQICTIDSFCVSLLRENAAALGLDPGFALCDEQRAAELKSTALENTPCTRNCSPTPDPSAGSPRKSATWTPCPGTRVRPSGDASL